MFVILVCIFLAGCVTIEETSTQEQQIRPTPFGQPRVGMTKSEVLSILGEKAIVGYELKNGQSYPYQPIMLNNPYRTEILKNNKISFEINYFFTGTQQSDGAITNNELVPLIFENDKFIGQGWPSLNKIQSQYKL